MSLLLKLAVTFPDRFLPKGDIYILLNVLFTNVFFYLQTYLKCLHLTAILQKDTIRENII